MPKLNGYLDKIEDKNVFLNVTNRVKEYKEKNPDKSVISLGIGDVSKPIVNPVIEAMHKAVDDLSDMKTFKGYGAYYGYDFLKEKILENDYKDFNFTKEEIYVSNGTKTDTTSILELFDKDSSVLITDPMYPIYRDGAYSLSRNVYTLDVTSDNNFVPHPPKEKYDIIYICSPSNPIGVTYTYKDLEEWVKYALENDSIILYDNVYASFIESNNTPKSIYEIKDADRVSIEFRSFSKHASFTGVRCSYYIIPNKIEKDINYKWKKRTINRFNGADYIAQRGAEATYLEESKKLIKKHVDYYKSNAKYLRESLINLGFNVYGGIDSPFMWVEIKANMKSWEFFDFFLKELNIIIIPGIIFGNYGDNYFRVSALASRDIIDEAIERIRKYYEK